MSKISALPLLPSPSGRETVVVMVDGETLRVGIDELVEAGIAPSVARAEAAVATIAPTIRRRPGPSQVIVRYESGELVDTIGKQPEEAVDTRPVNANVDAAVWRYVCNRPHVAFNGQSNGRAADTTALSTTPFMYAYMFRGGPMPDLGYGPDRTPIYASLEPLREFGGETPASGFARYMARLIEVEEQVDLATYARRPILSSNGEGGTSTSARLPNAGNGYYQRMQASITAAVALAGAANQVGVTATMVEIGGESDTEGGQTADVYQANIDTIVAAAEADAQAQSGSPRKMLCILSQCSNVIANQVRYMNDPRIALRQLQMAETIERYVLAVPLGILPHGPAHDFIHLNERGAFILGGYVALAEKRMRYDAHKIMPLRFTTPVKTGSNTLTVGRKYPGPRLAIETSLADPGGLGFSAFRPSTGAYLTVNRVVVTGENIEIWTAETLRPGDELRYGFHGLDAMNGYGCIRDVSGDHLPVLALPDGTTWRMHQYAPIQICGVI